MIDNGYAPNTINRRVSSVSGFYKYLQAAAAELRLPITVPNPAHAQFISRSSRDPVKETKTLSGTRARQLMSLPEGDELVAVRDRAIVKYQLIMSYLEQLPGAIHEGVDENGVPYHECIYTPHSLRATAATELLNAGIDIMKVKDLLGRRHVTTTQVYDKRRRSTSESASHEMPF